MHIQLQEDKLSKWLKKQEETLTGGRKVLAFSDQDAFLQALALQKTMTRADHALISELMGRRRGDGRLGQDASLGGRLHCLIPSVHVILDQVLALADTDTGGALDERVDRTTTDVTATQHLEKYKQCITRYDRRGRTVIIVSSSLAGLCML